MFEKAAHRAAFFLVCARHGAKRHRVALSRPAVVAARDDLEVQVLCGPGKGNH